MSPKARHRAARPARGPGFALVLCLSMSGCATHKPVLHHGDFSLEREPTVRRAGKDLDVSVEEFVAPEKSAQAFDANVASRGVLALLVRIQNKGAGAHRVTRDRITASLAGELLPSLDGKAAANQAATTSYAQTVVPWVLAAGPLSLFLTPVALIGSSAHTESVNRRVEQHFGTMELPDLLLRPFQSAHGFVFFQLPYDVTTLDGIVVRLESMSDDSAEVAFLELALPTFEISLHPSRKSRIREHDGD